MKAPWILGLVAVLAGCGSTTGSAPQSIPSSPANKAAAAADFYAAWACRDHAQLSDAVATKKLAPKDADKQSGPMIADANAAYDADNGRWGDLNDAVVNFRLLMRGDPTLSATDIEAKIARECLKTSSVARTQAAVGSDPNEGQDPAPPS